jgi:O-antigen/teichoic acid export membrane protein
MAVQARKVLGSFGWVVLSRYVNRVLGFVTTLVLAKVLVPEDFGLVALAAMMIEVLKLFKDMGLGQALIHRRDELEEASDTAFFMLVGVNLIMFLAAVVLSPFAAAFYKNDMVMPVLILMASNLVWFSFRAVPDALVRKSVDFQKLVIPEIVPVVLGATVAIWMAYTLPPQHAVWSLVVKALIVDVLGTILQWRFTSYRPKFRYNKRIAAELWQYGKYIVATTIVAVALHNIDRFYLSTAGTLTMLGIYTLAFQIANLPTTELGHVVCRVMFPVFTKLNQDIPRLRNMFLRTVRYSSLLVFPAAFGIAVYGPELVRYAYGDRWAAMILPMQLLCVYAPFRSLSAITHELFKAMGQPRRVQHFVLGKLLLIGALGIPAVHQFGVEGMAALLAAVYAALFLWEVMAACRLIELPVVQFFGALRWAVVGSTLTILGTYAFVRWMWHDAPIAIVVASTVVTGLFYAMFVMAADKTAVSEMKQLLGGKKATA